MKSYIPVVLLLSLAAFTSCAPAPPEPIKSVDAATELRPFVEKMLAAWATLDTSKVAPFYSKDPGLVFFDFAPLKYNGWADYETGFKKTISDWKSIKLTLNPDFQATRHGSIAWATYTIAFEIEPKTGTVMKGEGRGTTIFEKRGTDWIVIHDHASAPMPDAPPPPPAKKSTKR